MWLLLAFHLYELDKSKEYIMVCRFGGRRDRASQYIESYGFNVVNMVGGILAWDEEKE
ncbi:rhodanese-like domain-containing protein [Bacillus sp. 165]|nr:rhodanese-like domain-containing protein [Bacillus sp. 165]